MKIKILAGAALFTLMASCASQAPAPPPPPPVYRPPPPPPAPADQCGAAEAQKYVGRSRSQIPIPVLPALQRVACTTCPVTLDYSARRLNFFYDAQTGIVKEVKCG
ncbi:peptidase inhibitor I78 [Phenylobacterium sp.]|uniref:peptidase inhibitor I78 n=1 Tax=Phenylobacterium sp. TaxID=1871053 RepID=UPI0030F40079